MVCGIARRVGWMDYTQSDRRRPFARALPLHHLEMRRGSNRCCSPSLSRALQMAPSGEQGRLYIQVHLAPTLANAFTLPCPSYGG